MRLGLSRLLLLCIVAAAVGCSSCTAPADGLLDGTWTSGHRIDGLEFGADLQWTSILVRATVCSMTLFQGLIP